MRYRSVGFLIAAFCVLTSNFVVQAAPLWTGILDPGRATDWSQTGVVGGIPNRTTICATLNPGATGAQISSALQNCPAGQVVFLNAGTYNISGGITFNHTSNVTLRGAGADKTFLVFSSNDPCNGYYGDVCLSSQDVDWNGGVSNSANWTAGYAKGSTVITLSATTNLKIGTPVILDQTDDLSTSDSGDIFVCYTPQGTCSTNGDNGGAPRAGRSQEQMVTVTAINGNQVTITPAIRMANWVAGRSPGAWWPTSPITMSGIENLSMDHSASEPNVGTGVGVVITNCNTCWVKGVRSIKPGRSHVQIQQSIHVTVESNYFFDTAGHTSTSYGVEALPGGDDLVDNNIFQGISEPVPVNGPCSGCVFAYNFDINNTFGSTGAFNWQMQSTMMHAVGIENMLVEGDQGSGLDSDNFHGTHQFVTVFRNTFNGFQKDNGQTPTNNMIPIILNSFSRFYNIIGNVLGTSTIHKNYEKNFSNGTSGVTDNTEIYAIGFGDEVPDDTNTSRTLMRWGNWDVATGPSGGARFAAGEVPSGIASFPNPVPASNNLPASFYLAAKPAWWPASKPWPAIGPDVTGGNMPNVGGHAYTIPSADCYAAIGGPSDGTGTVLNFNADACYGTTQTPPANSCDLNSDGSVNATDVQQAVNQALGISTCGTADLQNNGTCNVVDVQRVANAALGGTCVTGQ